ncbi:hypothetical protein BGZ97_012050, partial [Linnemannia gamsii]
PGQGYHPGGLFPRQQQQRQQQHYTKHQLTTSSSSKHKAIEDNTAFEHVWSTSSSSQQDPLRHHYQADPWATQFNVHQRPTPNQRHLHDLDLISSWDHVASLSTTTVGQHPISDGDGNLLVPGQELSTKEFDAYYYKPPSEEALTDSLWAQEMVHTEPSPPSSTTLLQGTNTQSEDEEDDEEDEFREEWNNDHFTQAYINTHQSQFRQIEEQDRLKEARLAEERERQRVTSGGPPRSSYSWMMTGVPSPSTAMVTAAAIAGGQSRRRVPGLDLEDTIDHQRHPGYSSSFCVSEFESFIYTPTTTTDSTPYSQHYYPHQQQHQEQKPAAVKPIRAEDRFLSLVNDLHLAEQTYYPPASSATLPSEDNFDLDLDLTTPAAAAAHHSPPVTVPSNSAWAQEFTFDNQHQHQHAAPKKFLGAEWNWEKIFGKDPRKQLDSTINNATVTATAAAGATGATMVDENERLKAVALARLQAVFKHLTLAPSSTLSPP